MVDGATIVSIYGFLRRKVHIMVDSSPPTECSTLSSFLACDGKHMSRATNLDLLPSDTFFAFRVQTLYRVLSPVVQDPVPESVQ